MSLSKAWEVGNRWTSTSLPSQAVLWFCGSVLGPSQWERHWGSGVKISTAGEPQVMWGVTEGAGVFLRKTGEKETEKRRLDLVVLFSCWKLGCGKVGTGLFCWITNDWTRGNGCQLCQERFILVVRRDFLMGRFVKHWNRMLRKVVKSPSLEPFENYVDMI